MKLNLKTTESIFNALCNYVSSQYIIIALRCSDLKIVYKIQKTFSYNSLEITSSLQVNT